MFKKFLNFKIILISALFTALFGVAVFASDYPDVSSVVGDNMDYIVTQSDGIYYLHCFKSYDKCYLNDGQIRFSGTVSDYEYKNGKWQGDGYYRSYVFNISPSCLITSSFDIYQSVNSDKVFFSKMPTPFRVGKFIQVLPKTVMESIQILIPVGISALCLVVLVPYLVRSIRRFV